MPKRREDKELSKYSKYKARVDLTKIRQVASVLALLARSLARWGSVGGTVLARVRSRLPVLALRAFSDGASRELSRS